MANGKKLYRVQEGQKIAGICNGFAEYFEIDVTIVRIAWLVLCLAAGGGLIAYLICLLLMPIKGK